MEKTKQINLFLLILVAILGIVSVFSVLKIIKIANFKFVPPKQIADIKIEAVKKKDIPLNFEFIGRAEASKEVEIRSRVSGILEKRLYQEGSEVVVGERLFKIEEGKFSANLNSADGSVKKERANFEKLSKEKARFDKLLKIKAISQKEYDDVFYEYKQAEANLSIAEANLKNAILDLEYTNVNSPISGITSKALKFEGTYIDVNKDSLLTQVVQIDPIYINFNLAEADYLELKKNIASSSSNGSTNLENKSGTKIELYFSGGQKFEYDGRITFSDPQINKETGLIEARAEFSNSKNQVLPGQFVNLKIKGAKIKNAITVPLKAITTVGDEKANNERSIFVLDGSNQPVLRKVKVGYFDKDKIQVVDGLKLGERVVIEGQNKIRPGAEVKILNPEEISPPKEVISGDSKIEIKDLGRGVKRVYITRIEKVEDVEGLSSNSTTEE